MPTTQTCAQCGGELPLMHRSDRRHCSRSCEAKAYRARRRERLERVAERQASSVPTELRARPRWVRYSARKVPLRPDGRFASSTDPSSWSDYATARASTAGVGVGYVLAAGDGVVVVDLDHCVTDGRVAEWAQAIVDGLPPTYMERGASGTGLHLWFRGSVLTGRRIRRGEVAIEVYGEGRYIIVGDRVPGTPLDLADLPADVGPLLT